MRLSARQLQTDTFIRVEVYLFSETLETTVILYSQSTFMYSNSERELSSELTGGAAVFERGHMDV